MENKEDGNAPAPVLDVTIEARPEAAPPKAEDGVVSVEEIVRGLDRMEELEETAELLFATQDPSVCTYPEGYKPRQTVFACLTCTPAPQMAGVCYGCSLHCHENHEIVELYTKRKFKCDCGNSKFGDKKCTLYEEKDAVNEYNLYNHNYQGKFCTCEVYYPEDDQLRELTMCDMCEDWFHNEHMAIKSVDLENASDENAANIASMICSQCVKKFPFVRHVKPGQEIVCYSKLTLEQKASVEESEPQALMISNFRQFLCKCTDCVRVYEMADCEFLLDNEDDMATFEKESKEKAAQIPKPTAEDEMRELVKEVGMEGAQVFYAGVEHYKRKLAEFVMNAGKDGRTISEEDVKKFSAEMLNSVKRRRLEE